ncbi:recombinase family protein [Marinibaculum pumilum]|uniref:Recombinase family protein n=1 Tax=Marinibaculum pumilum TaxID=1766165 RepID=A0ABV7L449_9PROT
MSNDNENTTAVIYCRVSSVAQVTKGHGIASQQTRCEEFARIKKYSVEQVFRDEGVSGGILDRPGMQAMLAFLRKRKRHGGTVVLIDDISRLARDIKAHLDLRSAIIEAGGRLESPSIEFGEDSDSILVENLLASVSQHQRQKNAEQTANRMRARLLSGYWPFIAPFGYRFEKRPGQGNVMVPDGRFSPIIQEGLEGFASGRFQTQAEVKRFFESFPDFPKTRYGTVTNELANRILTQLLYAGYLERPEWGVSLRQAKHEALISLETYQRIQDRIAGRARVPARTDINEDFPLRGFVLCTCGKPLSACWSKSKTGAKHPYYACYNRECENARKSIRRDAIEGDFATLLAEVQPAPTMSELALAMFRQAWDQQAERARALRETVRRRSAEIEKQISSVLDRIMQATNQTLIARYEQRIGELERERLVLAEKLEKGSQPRRSFDEVFELTLKFLSSPCNIWENGTLAVRRTALKLTFDEPLVYCRNEGFRTPKTSIVFKALGCFQGQSAEMADGEGFEPSVPF